MTKTKYDILLKAYDEVNALDKHEDSKAERAVQALAFLTLFGASLFAGSVYIYSVLKLNVVFFKFAYVSFAVFTILLATGTALIIQGVRPWFNIPTPWSAGKSDGTPPSLFFAIKISAFPREKWVEYWKKTEDAEIEASAIAQLAYETHLISEKTVRKVRWLQIGFVLYLLSMPVLLVMAIAVLAGVLS